jgi:hypothetical protein
MPATERPWAPVNQPPSDQGGHPFHIDTPDFMVALIELASGVLVRPTTNCYVGQRSVMP